MDVIGHHHESVQQVPKLSPIFLKNIEEKFGSLLNLENTSSLSGHRCDEEGANLLRRKRHDGSLDHAGERGLKPSFIRRIIS